MELTPEQREQIQRLLEEELRAAWRAAAERGATQADVADLVDDRRHALDFLLLDATQDDQHRTNDARDGDGVGERR